jgi:hypothetical protein
MVKEYMAKESGNKVKVIQYDGTIQSLQEIIKIFHYDVTLTSFEVYIRGIQLSINDYCVQTSNEKVFIYNKRNFERLYAEYIPERKFKCDRRIMIHLWKEVHRVPDMYTVSIIDGFIVITGNVTENSVRISHILTVTRINPEYSFNSIEEKIIDMCDEIYGD